MKISTFSLKALALAMVMGAGFVSMNAQTFIHEGVVYKASGSKLTVQKPTVAPENGTAPGDYEGDIVIPATIEYNNKSYQVTSVAAAFKGTKITSIVIADGVVTFTRGCFQNCTELKTAVLPSDLVTMQTDLFNGCSSLEEIVIPGGVKEVYGNQFKGCTSLKKFTVAEGPTPLEFSAAAFVFSTDEPSAIEEVVINRNLGTKYTDMNTKPFRGLSSLKKVTIGGACTALPASYFESDANLTEVVFANDKFADCGTNLFAGTGIEEITLPATVTSISASMFQGCKKLKKVTLGDAVTSIQAMAFYNSTLEEINLPASLTSIGQMAFSGAKLNGALQISEAVKTIGQQAFANNKGLTEVTLPAATTSLGDGLFMGCTGIAKFTVDAASESYQNDAANKYITTKDGKTLVCYAPAAEGNALADNCEELAPYALYCAANITSVDLPNCVKFGDYSLSKTGLTKAAVKGEVGRYVLANCAALTELNIDCSSVPYGIAMGDAALANVTLRERTSTIQVDAFNGCSALKSLNLGNILAIIEADAFANSGIENLTVTANTPAAMAQGVFVAGMNITATVPVDRVDAYKAADGWKELTIAGDANLAVGPADMGMPAGLYYAGDDDMLHCVYADGETDTYDVGGMPHTFQLIEFANRIYGSSAGKKFVYSATGSVDGDGKLFYISKVGGEVFQATVLDNAGNNAYKDPFNLYIYGDTLYVNDRNVCIRKIPVSAIALPQSYPSWVENNWLAFYGNEWSYGCIKCGFAITQSQDAKGDPEPLYWVGMKYNGNGIFRFKEEHVGNSSKPGARPEMTSFFTTSNPIFTTFFVDEKNNHLYMYIEKAGSSEETLVKGGVYRFDLAKLEEKPSPSDILKDLEPVLVDGAPVKYEGSATNEHVGISQFAIDENGEYLYWCYRAPSESEAASTEAQDFTAASAGHYWWADKFDATNPLHQSGIKRVKLGEENPVVEMVVPGVTGYGVVPVRYEGSKKPEGVNDIVAVNGANHMTAAGTTVTVDVDATLAVYTMAGVMVENVALKAGQSLNLDNLAAGAYIVSADLATGTKEAAKVVVK